MSWPHKMPHKCFSIFDFSNYPLKAFLAMEREYPMLIPYKLTFSASYSAYTSLNSIYYVVECFAIEIFYFNYPKLGGFCCSVKIINSRL